MLLLGWGDTRPRPHAWDAWLQCPLQRDSFRGEVQRSGPCVFSAMYPSQGCCWATTRRGRVAGHDARPVTFLRTIVRGVLLQILLGWGCTLWSEAGGKDKGKRQHQGSVFFANFSMFFNNRSFMVCKVMVFGLVFNTNSVGLTTSSCCVGVGTAIKVSRFFV